MENGAEAVQIIRGAETRAQNTMIKKRENQSLGQRCILSLSLSHTHTHTYTLSLSCVSRLYCTFQRSFTHIRAHFRSMADGNSTENPIQWLRGDDVVFDLQLGYIWGL